MRHYPACGPAPSDLAGRSWPVAGRGFHLWGSVAPGQGLHSQYVDPTIFAQTFRECARVDCGGVWQITTTAKEYQRLSAEGSLLPLEDIAISQVPAGVAPFTRRTQVQLRIHAPDGVDDREFDMDANQSITIVASSVCVYWLGPANMTDVNNLVGVQRELPRTGFVIDSFLGVSLSRIEQPPGDNSSVVLTRHLFVPSGTRSSIAIPAYANEVTIYQEPTLGNASVSWTQTYGDPNGGSGSLTIAALPFIAGLRRTQQQSVLPNATHLWTDLDNADRFFTLRWTIRP